MEVTSISLKLVKQTEAGEEEEEDEDMRAMT
jgi:hypothetical protein